MIEKMIQEIGAHYPLTEKSAGEFTTFKASGMTFSCSAFAAEGLGHLSVMTAKGFFGLMKMDTLVVCPEQKDLPLFSYDRIYAMGNDTLIMELYDTCMQPVVDISQAEEVKQKYARLPDRIVQGGAKAYWYDGIRLPQSVAKKGKKKHNFDAFVEEYLQAYLQTDAPSCTREEKVKKTAYYVEGLLSHGGAATDVLKKELGEEKTAKLFRSVLFGTV